MANQVRHLMVTAIMKCARPVRWRKDDARAHNDRVPEDYDDVADVQPDGFLTASPFRVSDALFIEIATVCKSDEQL